MMVTTACFAHDHSPMSFKVYGTQIIAEGEIDGDTLDAFEDIIEDAPDATELVLQYVGGSVDDEANVEFSRFVRGLGFTTIVPSDGLVASGGTDLFLAGQKRLIETGACIGVHSWAAEDFTATDLPGSDAEHDRYLDYYDDMNIDQAFYWFTIQAAPADGMHWMSAAETTQFGMTTQPVEMTGSKSTCSRR